MSLQGFNPDKFDPGRVKYSYYIPTSGWGPELYSLLEEMSDLDYTEFPEENHTAIRMARSFSKVLLERWDLASGSGGFAGAIDRGTTRIQIPITPKERSWLILVSSDESLPPEAAEEFRKIQR